MKEVTFVLMKGIYDPETNCRVSMNDVRITGTPLQVACLFDFLRNAEDSYVDLVVVDEGDQKIYELACSVLENVRKNQVDNEEYEDPDLAHYSKRPNSYMKICERPDF